MRKAMTFVCAVVLWSICSMAVAIAITAESTALPEPNATPAGAAVATDASPLAFGLGLVFRGER